jgi:DNA-binding CsgD family transcriptional regulator
MSTRTDTGAREAGSIAELALASDDIRSLREALLDRLDDLIGFDLASFHSAQAPGRVAMMMRGYDPSLTEERLLGYMTELEPHEVAAAESELPIVDTDVIAPRRRERLALYREQMWPHRVSVFTTVMWRNRHGAFAFHLARCGRGKQFRRGELEKLRALLPSIKLAEAYGGARLCATDPPVSLGFDQWVAAVGLTRAERRITELVMRGLQNREIAALLRVSPLTVRNQLVSVFRKANVSNRAELVFLSTTASAERADCEPLSWSRLFGR